MTLLSLRPSLTSTYAEARAGAVVQSPEARLAEARALFAAGAHDRCLMILRPLLLDAPDDLAPLALLIEASGALQRNEKEKWTSHAVHAVNEIRRGGDMSERTAARTGQLLLRRGEAAAASAVCDWLERRFPDGAHAAGFLAEFYSSVGEPAAALGRLASAADAHPEDIDLASRVGERLIGWGRGAEALSLAESLAQRDGAPRTLILLARARIAAGAFDTVAELADKALAAGAPVGGLLPVAQDLLRAGAEAAAQALVDTLAAQAPNHAAVARLQAELALRAGRDAMAAEALGRAMEAEPNLATGEALAEALLKLDRPEEAAAVADRLAALDGGLLAPEIIRSKALRAQGQAAAADALDERIMARAAIEGTVPVRRQRVRMAGMIGPGGLGDFVYQLLALCSLKRQFADAGLTLFYSNDFSYKRDVLRFCPDVEDIRDLGEVDLSIPIRTKHLHGFRQHLFFNQAVLSPTLLTRLDRTATLVTPPEDVDALTAGLIRHGVDPDRWFVAMHYRESGSFAGASGGGLGGFNPATARDVDPAAFHRMAAAICQAGGQVVRLGHPGMAPLPKVPGYVDLIDGGLPLQMFAVSKARFMLACDSGPTSYATAFKTPLLKTNAICEDGAAYAHDLILNKNMINWRGEVMSIASMTEGRKALFKNLTQSAYGFRLVDNTFEQLSAAVDLMMQRTEEGGWRADQPPVIITDAPDVIVWPTSTATRAETLDLSHLAGRPVRAVSAEALMSLLPPPPGA